MVAILYHTGEMEPYEEHIALGTAVAVGLLIGLEREQSDDSTTGRFAGIRTYPIFALIGGLATMLEPCLLYTSPSPRDS